MRADFLRDRGRWMAYTAGAGCALGAVAFAAALARQEHALVMRSIDVAMASITRDARAHLRAQANALHQLKAACSSLEHAFASCRPAARLLLRTPGGPAAVEWIDATLAVRRRAVRRPDPALAAGTRTLTAAERARLLGMRPRASVVTTAPTRLPDGRSAFRILVPVRAAGRRTGFVGGVFGTEDFLRAALGGDRPLHALAVTVDGVTVHQAGTDTGSARWRASETLTFPGGVAWTVRVAPSRALDRMLDKGLPTFVLASGLLLGLLAIVTIRAWQLAARQARDLAETNRTLREEIEGHRRETSARITVEDQLRLLRRALRRDSEFQRLHLEEDLRQFASFVSHELRQPLASMQIFVRLLESRVQSPTEATKEYLGELRTNIGRMAESIEAQLKLVRSLTGTDDAPIDATVDLAALVAELRTGFAPRLGAVGGRLEVGPLPAVRGNANQLRQVFRNLIENALKYRHPQRPLVVRIEGRLLDDQDVCELRVSDNGSGFPAAAADTLFHLFRRLAPGAAGGSGVGLAICRYVVERHGGRIRAEGRPGAGATFIVTLPLADEPPAPAASAGSPAPRHDDPSSGERRRGG